MGKNECNLGFFKFIFQILHICLILFVKEFVALEFRHIHVREISEFKNFYPMDSATKVCVNNILSKIQCSDSCLKLDSCKSFFYHGVQPHCHMFDKEFTISEVNASTGWLYYLVQKDEIPSDSPTECLTNPDYTLKSEFSICFKIFPTPSYQTAQSLSSACSSDGAELIKITSQAMQDFFTTELGQITDYFNYVLIQGNDNAEENTWRYDDGTPLSYFYWNTAGGQPGIDATQNIIGMSKLYNFQWHDIESNLEYYFIYICQITV